MSLTVLWFWTEGFNQGLTAGTSWLETVHAAGCKTRACPEEGTQTVWIMGNSSMEVNTRHHQHHLSLCAEDPEDQSETGLEQRRTVVL